MASQKPSTVYVVESYTLYSDGYCAREYRPRIAFPKLKSAQVYMKKSEIDDKKNPDTFRSIYRIQKVPFESDKL